MCIKTREEFVLNVIVVLARHFSFLPSALLILFCLIMQRPFVVYTLYIIIQWHYQNIPVVCFLTASQFNLNGPGYKIKKGVQISDLSSGFCLQSKSTYSTDRCMDVDSPS